jgi:hypothetical protein
MEDIHCTTNTSPDLAEDIAKACCKYLHEAKFSCGLKIFSQQVKNSPCFYGPACSLLYWQPATGSYLYSFSVRDQVLHLHKTNVAPQLILFCFVSSRSRECPLRKKKPLYGVYLVAFWVIVHHFICAMAGGLFSPKIVLRHLFAASSVPNEHWFWHWLEKWIYVNLGLFSAG